VIVHEYGHAIQDDQVPNFGLSSEGGAMGEGFSDYLAAALGKKGWAIIMAAHSPITPKAERESLVNLIIRAAKKNKIKWTPPGVS